MHRQPCTGWVQVMPAAAATQINLAMYLNAFGTTSPAAWLHACSTAKTAQAAKRVASTLGKQ